MTNCPISAGNEQELRTTIVSAIAPDFMTSPHAVVRRSSGMTDHAVHLGPGTEDPRRRTPFISLASASAGVIPIAVGTGASLVLPSGASRAVERLTCRWAGALLCFLAGVRRGLSFREESGPTAGQLGTAFWLFLSGAGALFLPGRILPLLLLLLGFGSEVVLDPMAARRREAPRYFARLRPVQLAVPILSLVVLSVCGGKDRTTS
jgi:uncharacterized protein DUF3429